MKFLTLLGKYLKGIRLSVLFLTLMMTWAIFTGMLAYGRTKYLLSDLQVIKSADTDNAYMLMYFPTDEEVIFGDSGEKAQRLEAVLEKEAMVQDVFSIRVANPINYEGYGISIVLYEPEMLEFFPELKNLGIDFTDCPNGCILGSKTFNALDAGDTITLDFSKNATNPKPASLPVAGHMSPPYIQLDFSTSATTPYASDLLSQQEAVIMQATDAVLKKIDSLARRIEHDRNLLVVFRDDTSAEDRARLLQELAPDYFPVTLNQIIENSEEKAAETLKQELPQPLFLTVSSLAAYLSVLILTFKKKEKDIAVMRLCGGSRGKCGLLTFAVFHLISLLPVLLSAGIILLWPEATWFNLVTNELQFAIAHGPNAIGIGPLWNFVAYIGSTLSTSRLDSSCYAVIFGYYSITTVIALLVTLGTINKHTPITYLKGASQ